MATTQSKVLTDQQVADYNRDGYLILRDVVSKGDADELRQLTRDGSAFAGWLRRDRVAFQKSRRAF
jgi:hypothetical protein